ncbi:MAG TPA: SDR family NAD(P)-dependent oxidoreductase [Acidimicrobiales bacterium]|nr:SDR family NAD(P)-dependent oxidoreductase [Acidimicrobiales bacterium]
MTRLAGKRAVVTGAARGIGAAIAHRFASEGAAVALVDLQGERLKETSASLGDAPAVVADLADPTQARGAVDSAASALGGLDILGMIMH